MTHIFIDNLITDINSENLQVTSEVLTYRVVLALQLQRMSEQAGCFLFTDSLPRQSDRRSMRSFSDACYLMCKVSDFSEITAITWV